MNPWAFRTLFVTGFYLVSCAHHSSFSRREPANDPMRPRTLSDLRDVTPNVMVKLPDATLAWADYAALRRDFVYLRNKNDEQINRWILDNFAFMNREQSLLEGIRCTDIKFDYSKTKDSYRPARYERADIAPAVEGGFVDIKGSGLGLAGYRDAQRPS